jgi:hypothetical protein
MVRPPESRGALLQCRYRPAPPARRSSTPLGAVFEGSERHAAGDDWCGYYWSRWSVEPCRRRQGAPDRTNRMIEGDGQHRRGIFWISH